MVGKEQYPTEESIEPYVEILARSFFQRWDLYPRQLDDGSYITVHEPPHVGLLSDHLLGRITLGMYLLNEESRGNCLVLDADSEPDWRRLQALALALSRREAIAYLERSRRGGHLWAFLENLQSGRSIRQFGLGLLNYFAIHGVELFPKQDLLTTGPGSLIRLPFGRHRKSGRRYGFCGPDGMPLAPTLRGQIRILGAPETLPVAVYEQFGDIGANLPAKRASRTARAFQNVDFVAGEDAQLSDRIKAVPIRQFILRYVELSPSGRGLCPFHDDHNPSFAINEKGNYWKCFVPECVSGGSAIDFYMLYQERVLRRQCDFKQGIAELAMMLF